MNKETLTKINELVVDNIACDESDKPEILSFIDETLSRLTKPVAKILKRKMEVYAMFYENIAVRIKKNELPENR